VDVIDLAILALRLVIVALLYAFLVIVLRSAARGLQFATQSSRSERAPLRLVVLEPGASSLQAGQVVDVEDGTTLGRAQRADLVVEDPSVSGEHARLSRVGRAWVVADLGSTNGTHVNQSRVSGKTSLAEGDVLAIGMVRLQVVAR
jgi:pSer/pThr/pTyr-binding forkhead associated (FHA) protein